MTDEAAIDKEITGAAEYGDRLLNVISKVRCDLERVTTAQTPTAVAAGGSPTSTVAANTSVKLPKLEIAKYSGDPLKFREFWDSFSNTIDGNLRLAPIDKFKYLKSFLDGDDYGCARAIRSLLPTIPRSKMLCRIEHPVASHSVKDLQAIYDDCEKHIRSLVALGLNEDQYGLVFTPIILSKLPIHAKRDLHRQNGSDPWTLAKLRELLRQEIRARDMSERQFGGTSKDQGPPNNRKPDSYRQDKDKGPTLTAAQLNQSGKKGTPSPKACAFCAETSHRSDRCPIYPDHQSRRQKIGNRCANCLGNNHTTKACRSAASCFHCKRKGHYSSLCYSLFEKPASGNSTPSAGTGPTGSGNSGASNPPLTPGTANTAHGTSTTCFTNMQTAVAICTGIANVAGCPLRLLFDTGGFRSYISASAAKKIGTVKIDEEAMSLGVFEDKKRRHRVYDVVKFLVKVNDDDPILVRANVTDFITCPVYSHSFGTTAHPILTQVQLAEPPSDTSRFLPIDVLIGGDHYYNFVTAEQLRSSGGLVLLSSKLGYILAGTSMAATGSHLSGPSLLLTSGHPPPVDSYLDVEKFWRLEEIGIKDEAHSADEESALQQFSSTVSFEGGRYYVKWPRKGNANDLPENRELAMGRLRSLLRRLQAQPEMLDRYDAIIRDQLQRGIIEEAPPQPTGQVHYLPHHCVIKPQSLTTPVRVVYDASAKTRASNPSLNDNLFCGPLFLADLVGLLLRFRLNDVAIVSDIEKAFLHVGLQVTERDLVRFIWVRDHRRSPIGNNLIIFRFCRVPFGLVCSSFLPAACLLHHFSHYSTATASLLADNLYVDNIIKILAEASMNLRQWYSNSSELLSSIPEPDRGKGGFSTSVLGMIWDTKADTVTCHAISLDPGTVRSKRGLMQFVAKLFDPCGLLSPVSVGGKLIVQKCYAQKVGWDETLPSDVLSEWSKVGASIKEASQIIIPRRVASPKPDSVISLHCFCDASNSAYAAAVYLHCDGHQAHLILSKSKLAPLKGSKSSGKALTIPQLELMAVLIGSRLLQFATTQLGIPNVARFIWSDSQCVLHWVTRRNVKTPFVKNRVQEISKIDNISFRFVKSEDNPADLPSRGYNSESPINVDLWWHGPTWLSGDQTSWPVQPSGLTVPDTKPGPVVTESEDPESGVEANILVCVPRQDKVLHMLNYTKFSSLSKLTGTLARCLRFVFNCRSKVSERLREEITSDEYVRAKCFLQRAIQENHFSTIFGQVVDPKHKLLVKQLNLFRDDDSLIRCRTRLAATGFDFNVRNPILMPSKDHFTKLVIFDVHQRLHHAGVSHCLAELRQLYWVPKGRSQVKAVVSSCTLCRKLMAVKFACPPPPPLPKFRVEKTEVFGATGLDYLGPLYIRTQEGDKKVWILLFTCAAVRAIHLELVEGMTAEQFLLALRRFCSIFGTPALIIYDNAKQFKLTSKALHKVCTDASVQQHSIQAGISWKFITEKAPWFGGFYERLVGVVKKALRATLDKTKVSFAELQTLAYEISVCLNTRPITYVDSDIGSMPLSPSNFLLKGSTNQGLPFSPNIDRDTDRSTRTGAGSDVAPEFHNSRSILGLVATFISDEFERAAQTGFTTKHSQRATVGMPRILYISYEDPLSRDYVPRPAFFIGELCFTSITMAVSYIQAVQDGHSALAHEMHMLPRLRSVPTQIPSSFKSRGYEPSAKAAFAVPYITKDIFKYQFEVGGVFSDVFKQSTFDAGYTEDDLVVACGPGYNMECGIRITRVEEYRYEELPEYNINGDKLRLLMADFRQNVFEPKWSADILVTTPVIEDRFAQRTVLIVSDSMLSCMKDIDGRGEVIWSSGATFRRLVNVLSEQRVRFSDFCYVIIHCGINDAQRENPDNPNDSTARNLWQRMFDYIRTTEVERHGYPADRILVSCPILHPEYPQTRTLSNHIEGQCTQAGIQCLNWASRPFDPFSDGTYWNPRTSASDVFHINHAGIRELWKAWGDYLPYIRRLAYRLKPEPRRRQRAARR